MSNFTGYSNRSLDPKGRLMIPTEFREIASTLGSERELMLTNFDGCVFVYPMSEWERIETAFKNTNALNKRMRSFKRFFVAGAAKVTMDKQGRVLIPPHLRAYASLEKEVVVAGVGERFEVWDREIYEEQRREMEASFDEDTTDLADLGIDLPL